MKVGESFFIPGVGNRAMLTTAAYAHSKRKGGKFMVKLVDDGVRCWRVE
jgi:hypothetical protein